MEWNKEKLAKLYFNKFGLTLTPEELDLEWSLSERRTITPIGDKMNIAVSPLWIKSYVERELERTGLTLDDARFKKVREEIIPAIHYCLFLKKIGYGEHFICSSDSPDIILTNKENHKIPGMAYKKRANPIEVTFIKDSSLEGVSGTDSAEKLVQVIKNNKLSKAYSQHTTLLVVVDAELDNVNLEKIASMLKDKGGNFHEIDLWFSEDDGNSVIACVYPELAAHTLNDSRDLDPLMY